MLLPVPWPGTPGRPQVLHGRPESLSAWPLSFTRSCRWCWTARAFPELSCELFQYWAGKAHERKSCLSAYELLQHANTLLTVAMEELERQLAAGEEVDHIGFMKE